MGVRFTTKPKVIPDRCERCGREGRLGLLRFTNGVLCAAYFCVEHRRYSEFISKDQIRKAGLDFDALPVLGDNADVEMANQVRPDCAECAHPCTVMLDRGMWVWACPYCGALFGPATDDEASRLGVSRERGRDYSAIRLRKLAYEEYIQTAHWRKVSASMKWIANHRCQACNEPGSLNTHHRTYRRLGEERPEDLIVLCERCHKTFHGILPGWKADEEDEPV